MRLYLDANAIIYCVEGAPEFRNLALGWVERTRQVRDSVLLTLRFSRLDCLSKPTVGRLRDDVSPAPPGSPRSEAGRATDQRTSGSSSDRAGGRTVEDLFRVYIAPGARRHRVPERFTTHFLVDDELANRVCGRGPRGEAGVREGQETGAQANLKCLPPTVGRHGPDLHSRPSVSSSAIRRTRLTRLEIALASSDRVVVREGGLLGRGGSGQAL